MVPLLLSYLTRPLMNLKESHPVEYALLCSARDGEEGRCQGGLTVWGPQYKVGTNHWWCTFAVKRMGEVWVYTSICVNEFGFFVDAKDFAEVLQAAEDCYAKEKADARASGC